MIQCCLHDFRFHCVIIAFGVRLTFFVFIISTLFGDCETFHGSKPSAKNSTRYTREIISSLLESSLNVKKEWYTVSNKCILAGEHQISPKTTILSKRNMHSIFCQIIFWKAIIYQMELFALLFFWIVWPNHNILKLYI